MFLAKSGLFVNNLHLSIVIPLINVEGYLDHFQMHRDATDCNWRNGSKTIIIHNRGIDTFDMEVVYDKIPIIFTKPYLIEKETDEMVDLLLSDEKLNNQLMEFIKYIFLNSEGNQRLSEGIKVHGNNFLCGRTIVDNKINCYIKRKNGDKVYIKTAKKFFKLQAFFKDGKIDFYSSLFKAAVIPILESQKHAG